MKKMLKTTETQVMRAYKSSMKEIQGMMADMYAKYSKKGVLTYAEMAKYSRLEGLERNINKEITRLKGKAATTIRLGSADMYNDTFLRTAYSIETKTRARLAYSLLSRESIFKAIENPLEKGALKRLAANTKISINQAVSQSLINGESFPKMAKRVEVALDGSVNNAMRVARTEGHRSVELGRLDSMEHAEEKGVKIRKKWVAAVDARTRDTHQSMDGQTVDVDDNFVSPSGARGPAPGMLGDAAEDINCRCAMVEIVEGFEPTDRRIKGEGITEYKNYKQWLADK